MRRTQPSIILTTLLLLSACATTPTDHPTSMPSPAPTLAVSGPSICGYTIGIPSAPYYLYDAPPLTDGQLNYTQLPGSPLVISGYVYQGLDSTHPIPHATLDIWQADPTGQFYPPATGSASSYQPSSLALRGTTTTNDSGYYQFTTLYYNLLDSPAQAIFVKITAPSVESLTTQLIIPPLRGEVPQFYFTHPLPVWQLLEVYDTTNPAYATFNFHLKPRSSPQAQPNL